MATREQILDHNIVPFDGWLRWIDRPINAEGVPPLLGIGVANREIVLQQYSAFDGMWKDVPILALEELTAAHRL